MCGSIKDIKDVYPILFRREIAPKTVHLKVRAFIVARKVMPGQFVIVRVKEKGERIPLSICGFDRNKGIVELIIQAVGRTSYEIFDMPEGTNFLDVVGPLGLPTHIGTFGTIVLIGGGYGSGAIVPMAKALKEIGNKVYGIIGAREKSLLIFTDRLSKEVDKFFITTNDGSEGLNGLVTDALSMIIQHETVNRIVAIGPVPMMRAVSDMTKPYGIPTMVSLNAIMVDGTGMCGACRVSIKGETKFACMHGPEFSGHDVDFDELIARQRTYVEKEQIALREYLKERGVYLCQS